LIQSILSGDTAKYGALMQKYEGFLTRLGKSYIQDEDELDDFIQEVFVQVYQSLSGFRGESRLSTWIYRIARNQLTHSARLPRNIQVDHPGSFDFLPVQSQMQEQKDPEVSIHHEELAKKVRDLVSRLPQKYKLPIVLYYFQNLSYREISEKLNLKLNTLKSYIHRGRELLKEFFHE